MSKRKPLLTESELHRFMKLATIRPVADGRLTEMGYGPPPGQREEEEELDVEAGLEVEDPMGGEEELEMDAEMDMEEVPEDGGGAEEDLVMSLLQSIQGWAEENGVDMDLEGGEEEIGGDELEGGEEELELGGGEEEFAGGEEELEMGPEEEEMMDELAQAPGGVTGKSGIDLKKRRDAGGGEYAGERPRQKMSLKRHGPGEVDVEDEEMEESKVVETIARRVLSRLKAENNKDKMVDQLAERIMKRLTK